MASFEMSYDAEEDVLEVTFAVYDERFVRTLPLNDHVIVFADLSLRGIWGLTFYSYARLLGVSETELTGLKDLPDEQVTAVLSLLAAPPAAHFLDLTDPEGLIARVTAPNLQTLVEPM